MATQRFRLQFKFWLDVNKPDEHQLAEQVEKLKQTGSFTRALRDGLRLVTDLWQGRVEVLLALFPWVEEHFYAQFAAQQPKPDVGLAEQIARLERLLLERRDAPTASGLRPISRPDDEDDTDLVIVRPAASTPNVAQNFINSLMRLQQGLPSPSNTSHSPTQNTNKHPTRAQKQPQTPNR